MTREWWFGDDPKGFWLSERKLDDPLRSEINQLLRAAAIGGAAIFVTAGSVLLDKQIPIRTELEATYGQQQSEIGEARATYNQLSSDAESRKGLVYAIVAKDPRWAEHTPASEVATRETQSLEDSASAALTAAGISTSNSALRALLLAAASRFGSEAAVLRSGQRCYAAPSQACAYDAASDDAARRWRMASVGEKYSLQFAEQRRRDLAAISSQLVGQLEEYNRSVSSYGLLGACALGLSVCAIVRLNQRQDRNNDATPNRDHLHRLVDVLPESGLDTAVRELEAVAVRAGVLPVTERVSNPAPPGDTGSATYR